MKFTVMPFRLVTFVSASSQATMSQPNTIPVLFLTFARLDSPAGELPSLAREATTLRDILEQAQRRGECEVVVREDVVPEEIIKIFQDPRYR